MIKRLTRSLIKVIANTLKVLSYGFHAVFPNKRFVIPESAPPLFTANTESQIPRVIWQTNYTDRVTLPVYLNYLFNRLMAPCHAHRFLTTEGRLTFLEHNFNVDVVEAYRQIQIGAAQADFWRAFCLNHSGGVYLDIDAHLVWPLELSIRKEQPEAFLRIKTGEISNYFIASRPNNPHLQKVCNQILLNIKTRCTENIYDLTGPGVFTSVLRNENVQTVYYLTTVNQGNFTNEHFQYIDKPQGKWTKEQHKVSVLKPPQ